MRVCSFQALTHSLLPLPLPLLNLKEAPLWVGEGKKMRLSLASASSQQSLYLTWRGRPPAFLILSNSATFRYFGALLLGVYNCSIFLMYLPLYNYEISQTSLICLILFIATPVLFGYSLHDIFFTSSVFESKVALL